MLEEEETGLMVEEKVEVRKAEVVPDSKEGEGRREPERGSQAECFGTRWKGFEVCELQLYNALDSRLSSFI